MRDFCTRLRNEAATIVYSFTTSFGSFVKQSEDNKIRYIEKYLISLFPWTTMEADFWMSERRVATTAYNSVTKWESSTAAEKVCKRKFAGGKENRRG